MNPSVVLLSDRDDFFDFREDLVISISAETNKTKSLSFREQLQSDDVVFLPLYFLRISQLLTDSMKNGINPKYLLRIQLLS